MKMIRYLKPKDCRIKSSFYGFAKGVSLNTIISTPLEEYLLNEKILIQSQRLHVRTWKQSDLDALYYVMSQPRTHLYTQKEPWSREYTQSWLEWHLDHRIGWQGGTFNCPLILRATDQLIGDVGLNPFLKDGHIPEIEWQIGPEHWGKGCATEIGCAMLAYGFQEAKFPAIMGFTLSQHITSRRVMEKIGMTHRYDKEDPRGTKSFYRIEQHEFSDKYGSH
ncbi:MAG TPA: GNAT family N-acetyltransferase [Ktedonobacteraceae bacterium]